MGKPRMLTTAEQDCLREDLKRTVDISRNTQITRQYGRDDVSYETWYSQWSKQLAKNYTRAELEKRLGIASSEAAQAAKTHLRAIQATHSMSSQSQRRAQSRNAVAAYGEERIAINGALEIYDLFPEHTKEAV